LIVYVHDQKEWLRDWMIKGGLDYVFTTDPDSIELLQNDPILKHKSVQYIEHVSDLKNQFIKLYNEIHGIDATLNDDLPADTFPDSVFA